MIVLLLACETLNSVDVENSELAIEALATSDGASTEIDAKLTRGQGLGWTPVHVSGDEALIGYAGEEEVALDAVELDLGDVGYTTLLDLPSGGEDVGVRFTRIADDSIDDTVVTMPPDFTITAPTAGAGITADTALIVLWDAPWPDGTVTLTFGGDCIPGWQVDDTPDLGEIDIPAEALAADGQACGATLTLIREAAGTISEAWGAGGSISAQNGRAVTVAVGN